jgi:hypoxanthine phosphoribosyltransferase
MPANPFKLLISARRIDRVVERLARQIDRYAAARGISEFCVVCIMDGAFVFCADLVRRLKTPTRMFFVKARSYNGTRVGALSLDRLPAELKHHPVLVLDTIYDTGQTIGKVLHQVRNQTSEIALVVLVDKVRKAPSAELRPDVPTFVGFRLRDDPFLVGYGLDVDGRFRQLKDLRIYSQS